jgi:type II secretory pathway pseudopilin PulG
MPWSRSQPRPRNRPRNRGGFTIIEAAFVMVIVGVATLAVVELLAVGSMSNAEGGEQTTAMNLAANIREISLGLAFQDPEQPTEWKTREASVAAYDDLKDLDGAVFQPPLDVKRRPINEAADWSQKVTVRTVAQDSMVSERPKDPLEAAARVVVVISRNGREVYETSWVAVAPKATRK